MAFTIYKSKKSFWVALTEKYRYFLHQVIFGDNLGNSWKFDRNLDTNELTNALKAKGLVTSMLKGIEKKEFAFGDHPKPEEHLNTVKVARTRGNYVSYDLNGVIHFWI